MDQLVPSNRGFLLALCGLLSASTRVLALDVGFYRALDFHQPICDQRIQLDAAREIFVEIANPLPGVEDYNELVRIYRARNWESFDLKREIFRKVHETSPLLEPLSYLTAQAAFDRLSSSDPDKAKAAERELRDTLVLYPRSELAPIVSTTMAEYWIRAGRHSNALALFQALKTQHPYHKLSCLFTVGAGESAYLLGDREGARTALREASQICRDPRLKLAAEVRLSDLLFDTDPKLAEIAYDKILTESSARVESLHNSVLHNLGELKYRAAKYPSATYNFTRFQELRKDADICLAQSMKRSADLEYLKGSPASKVAGLYLAVQEMAPGTDIGRFSRLHAMMVTLSAQPDAERSRRLRIIDEEIDSVVDLKMREVLYVEKGLAWLETDEYGAVAYLGKIPRAQEGELGKLVRNRIAGLLDRMVAKQGEGALGPLEDSFNTWVRDSAALKQLGTRYEQIILKGVTKLVSAGDRGGALDLLDRWVKSPYWSAVPPSPEASDGLATVLLGDLFSPTVADAQDRENRATEYLKRNSLWQPFFKTRNGAVPAALAAAVGDKPGVQNSLKDKQSRSPASLPKKEPLRELTLLARASAAQRLGDVKEAEQLLKQIRSKEHQAAARESLLTLYSESKRPALAFDLALKGLAAAPAEAKPAKAQRALRLVVDGKLWSEGPKLNAEVNKLKLPPAEQAPYDFLAGRSAFEKKNCTAAVSHYEKGLASLSTGESAAEARFRLGKCLVNLKKPSQARKHWQDLILMEDSFWSPLAQNELKLIH